MGDEQMSEVNHEEFEKYMKLSQEIQNELIAEMGQEAYNASQHWVNNPLISEISKVTMFDDAIARAEKTTKKSIIELLQAQGVLCSHTSKTSGLWCALSIVGGDCNCSEVISLLNKGN